MHEEEEMLDFHMLSIVVHALSGIGAFIIGVVLLFQSETRRQLQLARAFVVLLVLLEVFLVIAILSHVTSLPTITQLIFGGLAVLGLYMIWRAVQAFSVLREHPGNQGVVIDHIGFNLISLFDGFAIVSAIDVHAPGWLVAVIAVGAVALGIYAINLRKKTLLRQAT
jgi:membrane-bound ClpP family serine protease